MDTKVSGEPEWLFEPHETQLFPWIEPEVKNTMTQRIDYSGLLSQCLLKNAELEDEKRVLNVVVKNYKSKDPENPDIDAAPGGLFSRNLEAESPESEERYAISFSADAQLQKKMVLDRKIAREQKAINLGVGNPKNLIRLQRREQQIERAWVFDNYLIVKSGGEIKFASREPSVMEMSVT